METPLATELVPPAPRGPAPLALRPMTLGEILDRALLLFRANFSRLLLVTLTFQVPMYAVSKAFLVVLQSRAPGLLKGELEPAQLAWVLGAAAATGLATLLLYQLALAALTTGAARAFLGEPIRAGVALREGLSRAPHLVGTYLLLATWGLLLLGLSLLPGIGLMALAFAVQGGAGRAALFYGGAALGLLCLLVTSLYLLLRYALVSEVVVIEKRSFVGALRRSASLMAGRVGPALIDNCKLRASIVYAVNFCISTSVVLVTSLPTGLLHSAYGVSPFDPERNDLSLVPLWASVPLDVLGVFAQSAMAPFGLLAIIVFYFDLRIKREGFDLELLASRLGAGK